MSKREITERLRQHIADGGTGNDLTTLALYLAWHKLPALSETDLTDVEEWAWEVNSPIVSYPGT